MPKDAASSLTVADSARAHARMGWLDIPWHPTLFAITIVVAYWLDTVVSPFAATRAIVVAGVAGIALTLGAWLVTRQLPRTGLVATGILGLLYSKHLVAVAGELARVAPWWIFVVWIAVLLAAIALAARLALRRLRRVSTRGANRFLNWAVFLYLGASLALAVASGKAAHLVADLSQGAPRAHPVAGRAPSDAPDIYLILLDGYPRVDVLEEAFELDNRPFVASLEERGFDVALQSTSTYLWTQQSLTSLLHMDYVEDIPDFMAVLDGRAARQPTLRDIVNDNPTFEIAREEGYQVIATGYEFEEVALRQADVYLDPGFLNEFELNLLTSTFAGDIVSAVAPDFASGQHRSWIDFQVRSPVQVAETGSAAPRLVIGHVSAPHQPTVFGADGEAIRVPLSDDFYADSPMERGEPSAEFIDKYRAQLGYLNRRFLEMVDGILAAADQPPVIILWADHGSATRVDWTVTRVDEASPDAFRERTATLFAALTPGRIDVFPDDIQPFDIFRLIADAYLGTDLGTAVRGDESDPE